MPTMTLVKALSRGLLTLVAVIALLCVLTRVGLTLLAGSDAVNAEGSVGASAFESQKYGVGVGHGPAGIAVDTSGHVFTGYGNGRLMMFQADAVTVQELHQSEVGRAVALSLGPNGGLIAAEPGIGLTWLQTNKKLGPLVTTIDRQPLDQVLAVASSVLDKNVYFVDAASGMHTPLYKAFLDSAPSGRLLRYNVATRQGTELLSGLAFPSGVAIGPNDEYLIVSEAAGYRLTRYWLKGPQAGHGEPFLQQLPGMPAQVSFDAEHHLFWVALYSARTDSSVRLSQQPGWVKSLLRALPRMLLPLPKPISWVIGVSPEGTIVYNLLDQRDNAYGPVSSVQAWGPWLYLGSDRQNSLARFPINQAIVSAEPPPAGWKEATLTPKLTVPVVNADEDQHEREEQEERESLQRMREERKAAGYAPP